MTLRGRISISDLIIFNALAQASSFADAANMLELPTAKIVRETDRLESELGATLFVRDADTLTLTEAGTALLDEAKPALQEIFSTVNGIRPAGPDSDAELTGTLRIASSTDHAMLLLAPALAQFSQLYPQLHIDLRTGRRSSDVISDETDIAIRISQPQDSPEIGGVKLKELSQYVVASPAYLQKIKQPQVPKDLAGADWISLTRFPSSLSWTFTSPTKETQTIQVQSRIKADTPAALRSMILHGAGISVLDQYSVQNDLDSGQLVRLLDYWTLPTGGIHAVFPAGSNPSKKVRTFVTFYQSYLQLNTP